MAQKVQNLDTKILTPKSAAADPEELAVSGQPNFVNGSIGVSATLNFQLTPPWRSIKNRIKKWLNED